MPKPNVLVVGGMNRAQSLWCIARGFERAGCNVKYIPAQKSTPEGKVPRDTVMVDIAKLAKQTDVLYWWQAQAIAEPDAIRNIRKQFPRMHTVCQSLDDPFAIDHVPRNGTIAFELAVTCCPGSLPWYQARGVKAIVGYPPIDEDLHGKAKFAAEYESDMSFAATNTYPIHKHSAVFASRVAIVKAVAAVGEVRLYGPWDDRPQNWGGKWGLPGEWRLRHHDFVLYHDMPKVHKSTKINLNSHVRPDGYKYLNERVTTCLGSGGFMLCDRVNGIEEMIVDGVHAAFWTTLEELVEKARWWLAHPIERMAVALAGRELALREWSNVKLARSILDALGIKV